MRKMVSAYSLPFKGRARVGMGKAPHPPPDLPLERGGEDLAN
jgi:hypothetical protein